MKLEQYGNSKQVINEFIKCKLVRLSPKIAVTSFDLYFSPSSSPVLTEFGDERKGNW